MLLEEVEEPMDFSRGSERLVDYNPRKLQEPELEDQDVLSKQTMEEQEQPRGLDLSVLDRLSQKAIR